jgi:hypothetical protein
MNHSKLCPITLTVLLAAWCSITTPALHAYDNSEDTLLPCAESLECSKLLSPTKLDFSLPSSSFIKITQENQGAMKSDPKLSAKSPEDDTSPAPEEERWSSFLPIWGEEAREKGHVLPLPFGVAGSFFYANRDIDVDSIDIDIRNISLNLDSLVFAVLESEEKNWAMRFDAWILPFCNIYLLGGYTKQHSDVNFDLSRLNASLLPPLFPGNFTLKLDLDGTTFGGGTTLVGGYKQYYLALDANYTITDMKGDLTRTSKFDQKVKALLFSARVGWRTNIGKTKLNLWIGGTYWDISQVIDGKVELPILGTIDFEVDQSPSNPISMHFGTMIEFTPNFNILFDFGSNFEDMFSLTPSLIYRF